MIQFDALCVCLQVSSDGGCGAARFFSVPPPPPPPLCHHQHHENDRRESGGNWNTENFLVVVGKIKSRCEQGDDYVDQTYDDAADAIETAPVAESASASVPAALSGAEGGGGGGGDDDDNKGSWRRTPQHAELRRWLLEVRCGSGIEAKVAAAKVPAPLSPLTLQPHLAAANNHEHMMTMLPSGQPRPSRPRRPSRRPTSCCRCPPPLQHGGRAVRWLRRCGPGESAFGGARDSARQLPARPRPWPGRVWGAISQRPGDGRLRWRGRLPADGVGRRAALGPHCATSDGGSGDSGGGLRRLGIGLWRYICGSSGCFAAMGNGSYGGRRGGWRAAREQLGAVPLL